MQVPVLQFKDRAQLLPALTLPSSNTDTVLVPKGLLPPGWLQRPLQWLVCCHYKIYFGREKCREERGQQETKFPLQGKPAASHFLLVGRPRRAAPMLQAALEGNAARHSRRDLGAAFPPPNQSYNGRKWLLASTKLFSYDNKSQLSHGADAQGKQFFLPVQ